MDRVDELAKILWDYHVMHQPLEKADCLLVLGSRDLLPAHRACDLFFEGYAPLIMFSGNQGIEKFFEKSEAETFAEVAYARGIPKESVLLEIRSSNTGENIRFSKELMEARGIPHGKIIVIQKPYMERRTFATFKKVWPEPEIFVTSPQVSYESYTEHNPYDDKERIIQRMVGDLQRIKEYPAKGFQIPQEIPDAVWRAYEELVALGYTDYLIK